MVISIVKHTHSHTDPSSTLSLFIMSTRPAFVQTLLDRPLPELTPPRLSDSSNPPYSTDIRAQIADLRCHPLLESVVSGRATLRYDAMSRAVLLYQMYGTGP